MLSASYLVMLAWLAMILMVSGSSSVIEGDMELDLDSLTQCIELRVETMREFMDPRWTTPKTIELIIAPGIVESLYMLNFDELNSIKALLPCIMKQKSVDFTPFSSNIHMEELSQTSKYSVSDVFSQVIPQVLNKIQNKVIPAASQRFQLIPMNHELQLASAEFIHSEGESLTVCKEEIANERARRLQDSRSFIMDGSRETERRDAAIRKMRYLREFISEEESDSVSVYVLLSELDKFQGHLLSYQLKPRPELLAPRRWSSSGKPFTRRTMEVESLVTDSGGVLIIHGAHKHGVLPVECGYRDILHLRFDRVPPHSEL